MRLRSYNAITEYVLGKFFIVPDTLSCSLLNEIDCNITIDVKLYIDYIVETQSTSNSKLWEIQNTTHDAKIFKKSFI